MKILIIDDNPNLVRVFAKMLQIKGFSAVGEITLKTGLQHLENESYDAVFVDASLGDYNEKQILTFFKNMRCSKNSCFFVFGY